MFPFSKWRDRLYTPTEIVKLQSRYFIVDCWHNRVLYSTSLMLPISRWNVLDGDLAGPHSIASDSFLYVVDDTGRGALRVYAPLSASSFRLVQTIGGCGKRPHRVIYDPDTSAFYVIASKSQEIIKLVRDNSRLKLKYKKRLPFLKDAYTRSISIINGSMYFVSAAPTIAKVRYKDDSYELLDTYPVPPQFALRTE